MSTPTQPDARALTRKQMREIRNTGATPIITGDAPTDDAVSQDAVSHDTGTHEAVAHDTGTHEAVTHGTSAADETPTTPAEVPESSLETAAAPTPSPAPASTSAPLPRAAVPPAIGDAPVADASVELGVAPLTRRQARQQERIRTASVPVITPDVAAAHASANAAPAEVATASANAAAQSSGASLVVIDTVPESTRAEDSHDVSGESADDRAVVSSHLGADLLAGEPIAVALPPSFDQLISRSVTGAVMTGNALILSQTPSAPPLSAPVTATGEVLITGSFNLPEGLGSRGHAPGTADGKEVDAVLIDGELPAHSSPTPIAASAAISTVKTSGDVITPPSPEKGGRLMMTLAITAGVLALALVGVLILAFVTGVF